MHLVGTSDIGKSFLLCRYHLYINSELRNAKSFFLSFKDYLKYSDKHFVRHVVNYLYNQISSTMGFQPVTNPGNDVQYFAMFIKDLETLQNNDSVVFLFDEVSMLSSDQVELLEDYLLSDLLRLPNVFVVLTGRYPISGWKDFSLRPTARRNVIKLFGFNLDDTQSQIENLNPQAIHLAPKIYEISGGSPGNNKTILGYVVGIPPEINELDALHACNQEMYDAIAVAQALHRDIASEFLPALEALCVLQDFDKEYEMPIVLAAHPGLPGAWDVRRSATLLSILSSIQVGPGKLVDWDKGKSAYAIEEQIRFNLEKELRMRDENLWKTLHCTAMKMYAQWANDYPDTDIFGDKSEYHKTQLVAAGFDPDHC